MREIKFMAWDKEKKMWTNWECYDNVFFFMDKNAGVWIRDDEFNRFSLIQYTGLKDKEEREVYEGDIYKDEENMLWEVIFDKEDCAYKLENLHTPGRTTIRNVKDMDHVGNIYENLELLEE